MKKTFLLIAVVTLCLLCTACKCEHQYEEKITTEASCTAVGVKTFTCKECNESYTEEIPMTEHTYTSSITKEPTCSEKGVTTFTCTACNDNYTEEIELIPHTFGEATITKEPTCIAEGEKTATCTVCGATEVSEKMATVAHTYQSKVTVAATCTEKGVNTLTCSVCNDSREESSKALGHNYQQSNVITKCTCTSDGEVTMTCSRCKDSYNETKKATGHNWVDASCTQAKYCRNCNLKEGDALGHNYQNGKCTRCGKGATVKFQQGFPFELQSYYRGNLYSTIIFESLTYSATDNGDGTVNIVVRFKGTITQYAGGASTPYVQFWVHGTGRSNVVGSFQGAIGTSQTSGKIEIKNAPIGEYTLSVSAINK